MSESLTPTEGARFLLERRTVDGATATYRAVIFTPTSTHEGRATLAEDGTVRLDGFTDHGGTPEAPAISEDLLATLTMLARLTARSAAKKREDGLPPWPARILRWRGPGRGE